MENLKKENKKYQVVLSVFGAPETLLVSEDLVVEYRLLKGKELSEKTFASLKNDERIDDFVQLSIKYALRYLKSELEVKKYLIQKGAEETDASLVIKKLKEKHVLDDFLLLDQLVEQEFDLKKNGPLKLKFLFENKGFTEDMILSRLAKIPYSKIVSNMEVLFEKKLPTLKNNSLYSAKQKMIVHLSQKGYEFDQAQAFVIEHQSRFSEVVDSEKALLREFEKALRKVRHSDLPEASSNQKIIASLARKGFKITDIKKLLERTH